MATEAKAVSEPQKPTAEDKKIALYKPAKDFKNLRDLLASLKDEIAQVLPRNMTPERLFRIALTSIQRQPALQDCSAYSVLGCVVQCGQLALEPDPVLGQAYMVPFRSKHSGRTEATFIIGYRGLIALAHRSNKVAHIGAEIVRGGDEFEIEYGTAAHLRHKPPLNPDPEAHWLGVYAIVRYTNGGYDFEWLSADDVERTRNRSRAKDDGPWQTDAEAMWRKTAIRALAKRMPLTPLLQQAAAIDEYRDAGVVSPVSLTLESAELLPVPEAEAGRIESSPAVSADEPTQVTKLGGVNILVHVGDKTSFVRFPNAAAAEAFRAHKLGWRWDQALHAWTIPASHTDELVAASEQIGATVTEVDSDWNPNPPLPAPVPGAEPAVESVTAPAPEAAQQEAPKVRMLTKNQQEMLRGLAQEKGLSATETIEFFGSLGYTSLDEIPASAYTTIWTEMSSLVRK